MPFSLYLRTRREEAGLSQQKLADLITARGHNVTAGNISNIERAYYKKSDGSESQPDKAFVINAAEVLGVDVNEALLAADYAPLGPLITKPQTLPELLEILDGIGVENVHFADTDALAAASPEELQEVLEAVQFAVRYTLSKHHPRNAPFIARQPTRKRE